MKPTTIAALLSGMTFFSLPLTAQWLVPPSYVVTPYATAAEAVSDAAGSEGSVIPIFVSAPNQSWSNSTGFLSLRQAQQYDTPTIETAFSASLPAQQFSTALCTTYLLNYSAHNFSSYTLARSAYDGMTSPVKATAYILKTNAGNAPYIVVAQESATLCL